MSKDNASIPMRKTAAGVRVETRPAHVDAWLKALPYVDFEQTSRLILQATRATNEQDIRPAMRLELVELYHRPYQYYVDSQVRTGAQHTLQSIEAMRAQLDALKSIALNLSHACRAAADDLLRKKSLWGHGRLTLQALLWSLYYLSHAMIFSFLEYAPVPSRIWREMHSIYETAESQRQEQARVRLPDRRADMPATTIADAYKRIVMASLADPHHLPFGAIWEIFEQLDAWTGDVRIVPFTTEQSPEAHFVVRLDSDARPMPYLKFDVTSADRQHRLVDASAIGRHVRALQDVLQTGQSPDADMRLSPYHARNVLVHMARAWGLPPRRALPRQTLEGTLLIACGMAATYFCMNGEREYQAPGTAAGHAADAHDGAGSDASYTFDAWDLVDAGRLGFSVSKRKKPLQDLRVGELVAMARPRPETTAACDWMPGVTRWMMVEPDQLYRLGVERIAGRCQPASVRALHGSTQDCRHRRALLIDAAGDPGQRSLIAERGLHISGRELQVVSAEGDLTVVADRLFESAPGFEHFLIRPV